MALFLSGIFPGLGQLYNRQPVKAALFLAGGIVPSWLLARSLPGDPIALLSAPLGTDVIAFSGLLLAIWIWSLVDAVVAAGRSAEAGPNHR
jgi:hypothetical protein